MKIYCHLPNVEDNGRLFSFLQPLLHQHHHHRLLVRDMAGRGYYLCHAKNTSNGDEKLILLKIVGN